jgi:hypothetical protein
VVAAEAGIEMNPDSFERCIEQRSTYAFILTAHPYAALV